MTTLLVLAKAPVAGRVKTRLAADLGDFDLAADLAAAALLDTIDACTAAVGADRCRLALDGSLAEGRRSADLLDALAGWTVVPQCAGDLADRLAHAHEGVTGPVVQVGMDTPQLTAALLHDLAEGLDAADAVLAPAADGGWWALALRSGRHGGLLRGVPMSGPRTYADTLTALNAGGLRVVDAPLLEDADHLAEARRIAAAAPATRFARALHAIDGLVPR
ncbi:TIGR04282 family arsenosugar biosynthesis glycosyltransferase [Nocardioides ultimimeridianus]